MKKWTALIISMIITGTFLFVIPLILYAEIPQIITFQGKLADADGNLLNGQYDLTFRIYDAETTGTSLLWQEAHNKTIVTKGIFAVPLGVTTPLSPLAFDKQYVVTIQVGANPEMSPPLPLYSSPYSIRSDTADRAVIAETAVGAQALIMPAQNGDILYYYNGWKRLASPEYPGMYLTSQEPGLPPIWTRPTQDIMKFASRLEELIYNSSMNWVEHLSLDITFPDSRYLQYDASIEMRMYDYAIAQARITIDGVVYQSASNSSTSYKTYTFEGTTTDPLPSGKHIVKIEIRTDRHNLAAWRNCTLMVIAPAPQL